MARKAQDAGREVGALPAPLAAKAGERVSPQRQTPDADRTLTRRAAPTSAAGGKGSDRTRGEIDSDNRH